MKLDWDLLHRGGNRVLAPESTHQVLKGKGTSLGIHSNRFPLHNEFRSSLELPDVVDHVREAGCHICKVSGVNAHLLIPPM